MFVYLIGVFVVTMAGLYVGSLANYRQGAVMLLYFLGAFIVTVIVGSWIMAGLIIKWTEGDD